MRGNARFAGAQGKPWFQWGCNLDPSASDPRCIRFRAHVASGQPGEIEILAQLRKADQSGHRGDHPGPASPTVNRGMHWTPEVGEIRLAGLTTKPLNPALGRCPNLFLVIGRRETQIRSKSMIKIESPTPYRP
jgi:hypothetical protein